MMRALEAEGVDIIFGYPGGQAINIYDGLYQHSDKLKHILTRHEQGAVHAAQGYARVTGRVGVCIATSGPGATNLITGIADAMLDSTPLVCITGQVPAGLLGSDAFQEADIVSMTMPVTKWNFQVTSAQEIPSAIARAFYIARSGRPGPVLIDITKNSQIEEVEFKYEPCTSIRSYKEKPEFKVKPLDKAVDMINGSQRPFIAFGQGVKLSGAEKALVDFAEKGNIPMGSTVMGLSAVATDHPLYMGMLGMHGNLAPNILSQESDLIIAVGMRFSDRITGSLNTYAKRARIIHIDIDNSELNKNVRADIGINADALEALQYMLSGVKHVKRKEWMAEFEARKQEEYDNIIGKNICPDCGPIMMAEVIRKVSEYTGGDAIVVTDVGQQQMMAARYSLFNKTRSLITSGGLGTMGFGLPAAIGAKVGAPDRNVVLFAGDGGIQMTIQELGTIMQWGIGVKIVVLNNTYLGMVRQWQQLFFGHRYSATELVNPDFVQIAAAYGIKGEKVSDRARLHGAIEDMFADDKAYLLEVEVDKEANVFPMMPPGGSISNLLYSE